MIRTREFKSHDLLMVRYFVNVHSIPITPSYTTTTTITTLASLRPLSTSFSATVYSGRWASIDPYRGILIQDGGTGRRGFRAVGGEQGAWPDRVDGVLCNSHTTLTWGL